MGCLHCIYKVSWDCLGTAKCIVRPVRQFMVQSNIKLKTPQICKFRCHSQRNASLSSPVTIHTQLCLGGVKDSPVGKGSVLHSQGLRTSTTLQVFIKYQQLLSALKIQAHYAGGRDPETSTTARELWLLCKLNQIDPMGIDLLGLSCSDMDENSGIIICKHLQQRAHHCCSPCCFEYDCAFWLYVSNPLRYHLISIILCRIFSFLMIAVVWLLILTTGHALVTHLHPPEVTNKRACSYTISY